MIVASSALRPSAAWAWGGEGHEVVGLVADRFLLPDVRALVDAMLATDADNILTGHDVAQETKWADRIRDEDAGGARLGTRNWHFVDIELSGPNLDSACYGHPRLQSGVEASHGPARDCIIDKVAEFEAELHDPATAGPERLAALKFLLHFVGDLHQPLHAADDKDRGGNAKRVRLPDGRQTNLHALWDTAAVGTLGRDPRAVARDVEASITPEEARSWQTGTTETWAMETFDVARGVAYGRLPPPDASGIFDLNEDYLQMARRETRIQLGKAGVRLALIINRSLSAANLIVSAVPSGVDKNRTTVIHSQPDGAACTGDQVVWINLRTGVYHLLGDRFFGRTKSGAFVCEKNALKEGAHAARGAR